MNNIYKIFFKSIIFLMKNIRDTFLRFNTVLNKKNGYSESLGLSIKHKKQNNIIIKEKEFKRRTQCEEFGKTGNDDI